MTQHGGHGSAEESLAAAAAASNAPPYLNGHSAVGMGDGSGGGVWPRKGDAGGDEATRILASSAADERYVPAAPDRPRFATVDGGGRGLALRGSGPGWSSFGSTRPPVIPGASPGREGSVLWDGAARRPVGSGEGHESVPEGSGGPAAAEGGGGPAVTAAGGDCVATLGVLGPGGPGPRSREWGGGGGGHGGVC